MYAHLTEAIGPPSVNYEPMIVGMQFLLRAAASPDESEAQHWPRLVRQIERQRRPWEGELGTQIVFVGGKICSSRRQRFDEYHRKDNSKVIGA